MKCTKCNSENRDTQQFCGDCGAQLPKSKEFPPSITKTLETPREELTTGSTFAGRYQIIDELGKGGMGKVFRVLDKKLNEEVALKLIKPEISLDKKTVERFSNELKISRKIVHKNIARMFDLNEENETHYITMEYVRGEDLKRLIRKMGHLSAAHAIPIAKQICEAMEEAHRLGVVHRDLKPQNVMVDEEGNVRIMDFGIARSLESKGITGARVMIGTPEYMSPEQVEGKDVDQRSDIYSLGVMLYEMVTGRVPFEGDTPFTIGMKHKGEAPKNPIELNARIPEDLSDLILKCLEKDKDKRYQSAGEVRSDLTNIEKGFPTTERVTPKKKPLTSKEITVTFGLRKLLIPAFVFVALVIGVLIIWQLLFKREAVPILSDKPSLAVLYFENNTGDEDLDHWRKMLSDLLITDLSQSKYLRILSGDRLLKILSDMNRLEAKTFSADVLEEVASRGRVQHLLLGKYAKLGDVFRIDIQIQEAHTGEIVSSIRVEARGEAEVFRKVDELTRKIKTNFRLSEDELAADIDREVGKITTSNPEAFKYYIASEKFSKEGRYHESINLLEKAVAIDPEFAMAYRSMAWDYYGLFYRSQWRKNLKKAMEMSDRISDRERYLIQGDFYLQSEINYYAAEDAYKKLLLLYPDDQNGNLNLGSMYLVLEKWDKAKERFDVLIQNKDENVTPYTSMADAYMAKGLYDKAEEVLVHYLNEFSDNAVIRQWLATCYIVQKRYDLALSELERAFLVDPSNLLTHAIKGDIFRIQGNFDEAEEEFLKLLNSEEEIAHYDGRAWLTSLYLQQGKFESSREQIKFGIELGKKIGERGGESGWNLELAYRYLKTSNPEEALKWSIKADKSAVEWGCQYCHQKRALVYKGVSYLELDSLENSQNIADELKEITSKEMNEKLMRYYYYLMGRIAQYSHNLSTAIDNFEKAVSLLPSQYSFMMINDHAFFIDPLAQAYYEAGELDKALETYNRIIHSTLGRLYWGDIYAKSFFMLGKIHEEQGNIAKAIEHYEKFLTHWKDSDPGLPEVDDARKRLAGLKRK
jgi:serine/threonine protein kinase/lipopolysaccharide biosynthesis regulator YciM